MFDNKLPRNKTITYATLIGVAVCSLVIGLVVASRLNFTPLLNAVTSKVEGKKNDSSTTPTEDLRTFVELAKEMKPELEVALCLEEKPVWTELGIEQQLGKCNCVL